MTQREMSLYDAVMIAEGAEEAESYAEYLEAWQKLHDTGMAYSLQGWFGRQAVALIEAGEISP